MRTIYLFDVDGTLTPPRQEIEEDFASVFLEWSVNKEIYLVTGSDIKKTREQLFGAIIDACQGVFSCSGNQYWEKNKIVYQNKFRAPNGLLADLQLYLDNSENPVRAGKHVERRPGMINFSTLGRNATLEQRAVYNKWDNRTLEREDIVDYITSNYPQLDVSIGGSISVDIYRKGKDKSQVVEHLRGMYGEEIAMIFVGDRCQPGGNDWPLAQELDKDENSHWFLVHKPEDTRELIEQNKLFIEGGV